MNLRFLRTPVRLLSGPARRSRRWIALVAALALLLIPSLPSASAHVVLQFSSRETVAAVATLGPLTATTVAAGAGVCRSTETATVPFVTNNARAMAKVVEPRTCPTLTRLIFLPAILFSNGLAVPAGHLLDVRLDLTAHSGTFAMLRNVQLYVQHVGAGNAIVTPTHIVIRNGLVTSASTSAAALTAGQTYGIGLRMTLARPLVSSSATLTVIAVFFVNDGGVPRAFSMEFTQVTLTY